MNVRTFLFLFASTAALSAAAPAGSPSAVTLPGVLVYSPRVANQDPVDTFAMPVSALRFEPLVDIQVRNFGEGQADVTIRGGIFENTGFRIGGVSLYDPQTGHYFAEIPIAPAMLEEPAVLTGVDNALHGFNANVGTIDYGWRRISTRGEASAGLGEYDFERVSFYQGYASDVKLAGRTLAADTEYSRSKSDGSIDFGDHRFWRANARVQLSDDTSQTDLFYGYQEKFFGWPNLYTPFGVNETENLQTNLVAANHRIDFGGGDFAELGGFYRRNKDDYEFNRLVPGLFNPYQHTTWTRALGLSGRSDLEVATLNYSGEVLSDNLKSTALKAGRFMSRTYYKAALIPEKSWSVGSAQRLIAKAGATFDDTNRDGSAVSPALELALLENHGDAGIDRFHIGYSKTTQVPTYTALNSSPSAGLFRGNPDLGRERSHNVELGWSHTRGVWSVSSTVFYRRDDNLVDWTFSSKSPNARTADAVDIDTLGFESVLSYTTQRLRVVLGYTFLDKEDDYGVATIDASFYALNYARHRLTAAIVARLGGGFEVRMDNVARIQEDNALRKSGGDEALISSLALAYLPPAFAQLELSVAASNLWNSNFQEVPAVPAPNRQVSAGVTYRW